MTERELAIARINTAVSNALWAGLTEEEIKALFLASVLRKGK